nr:HAMP domain-containing protein [uncultured Rhodopila sp.]
MSLRIRLVLWLGCVLAVTLVMGCALAGWHAGASVQAEMQAALSAGEQSVANGIAGLSTASGKPGELQHLVATFDGNRHVRASLRDSTGGMVAASSLQPPAHPVPMWFHRLIGTRLPPGVIAVPGRTGASITLIADSANEVGEVWDQAADALRTLTVFFALSVLLIYWTVGRALGPLERLTAAFARIGAGDYEARIRPEGPPELARLAGGFNRMAEQLGQAGLQNRVLREQILSLQEDERADLARDLHDEVGPFLFAAAIDAASIPGLLAAGQTREAKERAGSIGDAVAHMQSHIRSILGRLRPLSFGSIGLADAIENIVAFWRARRPGTLITAELAADDDTPDEAVRATICRVVQESICNALRHGSPGRIEISVARDADGLVVRVSDDGAGPGEHGVTPGFGLAGMRERVQAQAGTLAIAARDGGRGMTVTARLPAEAAA